MSWHTQLKQKLGVAQQTVLLYLEWNKMCWEPGKGAVLLLELWENSYHCGERSVPELGVMVTLKAYGDIDIIPNLMVFLNLEIQKGKSESRA